MASTDARPIPRKNVAMRVTFPLRDVNGDLVTGATGLDSEVSKDGGAFADATSEATEIATASGIYYLDLTATEMNADTVAVIVKSSAKTFALVMYPEEVGDMRSDVVQWNGTAVAVPATAGIPDVNVKNIDNDAASASGVVTFPNATLASTTNITAGTVTTATNVTTVNGLAANVITAASVAADAGTEIAAAVWDKARSGHVVAGSFGEGAASVQGNVTGSVASVSGAVGSVTGAVGSVTGAVGSVTGNVGGNVTGSVGSVATGGITAASLAADAITAAKVAADVTTEIQAGLATAAALATVQADTDDIQTRLPAALVLGRIDASVGAMAANTMTAAAAAADLTTELQTGLATAASIAALNNITAADVWAAVTRTLTANTNLNDPTAAAVATAVLTTAMTESYSADGAAATLAQAIYLLLAHHNESTISGTTKTVKKLDGTTAAATYTLDSATTPTAITRAT